MKTITLSLLLFIFLIKITYAEINNNKSARDANRILNGYLVTKNKPTPWMFSLQRKISEHNYIHYCGAVFIQPKFNENNNFIEWQHTNISKWLLTAAHCVTDEKGNLEKPDIFLALGGSLNIGPGEFDGEAQKVEKIFVPNEGEYNGSFDIYTMENDIALLKLSEPKDNTRLNATRRRSIKLPTIHVIPQIYKQYTSVYTSGWGRDESRKNSKYLKEVRLPLVSKNYCSKTYAPYGFKIFPGMLCAGYSSGEFDSCLGDSGGGLYYRPSDLSITNNEILLGLVSFGIGCGYNNLFGIYTNVTFHSKWIQNTIKENR